MVNDRIQQTVDTRLPNSASWNHFWSGSPAGSGGAQRKVAWSKQRIAHILQDVLMPGQRVLDAGCGSGYFSQFFADAGLDATALDYSDEALNITRQVTRNRVRTVKADMVNEQLGSVFIDVRFDLIFSDGLFEHFDSPDQDRILKNFSSILNARGIIVTVVPNRWSPWQLIRPMMMPGIAERPFILGDLKKMHTRNGLQVIRSGGINVFPWRCSPEFLGKSMGMLLYVLAQKDSAGITGPVL